MKSDSSYRLQKQEKNYLEKINYFQLIDSNYYVLFKKLLKERNTYLRYFAYSETNLINFITVLYEKLKFQLDEYTMMENFNINNYIKDSEKKNNQDLEIQFYENNALKLRELMYIMIKLIQNMIIDIGLSSGEIEEEPKINMLTACIF